jgi:hypothetical protein
MIAWFDWDSFVGGVAGGLVLLVVLLCWMEMRR